MHRRRYLADAAALLVPSVLAGCSGDEPEGSGTPTSRNEVYRSAFVDSIERDNHAVVDLEVAPRVQLTYSPATSSEAGVEESIGHVARAFFDRVNGGWDVAGLDASVRVDGSIVATWNMESAWIEAYVDGDITRDELGKRVEDSVERRDTTATSTDG